MQVIILTKSKALMLLGAMHAEQRDLNWPSVYKLRHEMNENQFDFRQTSPLTFCPDKKVKNGQHRIMAFLLSNLETITVCALFE